MESQVAAITKQLKTDEIASDPEMRKLTLFSRSLSHFFLRQYEEGIADIDAILSMHVHLYEGEIFNAHYLRGIAYLQLSEYNKALSDLIIAESLQHDHVDIYTNLGAIYFRKAEYELARKHYSAAIELDDNLVIAYVWRSAAHRKLGDDQAAQRDYEKALKLGYDPEKQN